MPYKKKVTEMDIQKELEKTTQLLRKIKGERMNPGMPLHLAPKGKKKKSKSRSKSRSKPKSSSKKKKLEMLGIKPQLLFGLDESELGALLDNPQFMSRLHLNDFRPPDDDSTPPPGRYGFTGPALGYDYVPGADPMAPETLQRTTNKPIRQEVLPEVLRPRFG